MKKIVIILLPIILLFAWNELTCQFCPRDNDGEAMTMQECAIHGENSPITRSYGWTGWKVNVWIPFIGCIANDPTPVDVFGIRVEGWFKGWHQVRTIHFRFQ